MAKKVRKTKKRTPSKHPGAMKYPTTSMYDVKKGRERKKKKRQAAKKKKR